MTETIEARVARGVALLDKTLADWDERIDLDRLNLRDTCDCILGQEFTDHPNVEPIDMWAEKPFYIGVNELFGDYGDPHQAAVDHGFNAKRSRPAEYNELTAEWKRIILARRGEVS